MGPIMTEPLSRDDVIALLEKLGGERDEDVLEAAREIHTRIAASGMTWQDLLVSDGGAADADDDIDEDEIDADIDEDEIDDADDDDETDDDETDDDDDTAADDDDDDADDEGDDNDEGGEGEATRPAAKAGAKHADSMALIDELLAKSHISADMREELEGYKTAIAEGEFDAGDRRYLSAVHKRLSKRR